MSDFETLWSGARPFVDDYFGEALLIEPRIKDDPNGRGRADPARPAQNIVGIWKELPAEIEPINRTGHPAGEGARFASSKPSFDFETTALPYALARDDLVTRLRYGTRYAIAAAPDSDGFSRTIVKLTGLRGRQ